MTSVLTQDVASTSEDTIGSGGLTREALRTASAAVNEALTRLQADDAQGRLALLSLPERTDDLMSIQSHANRLREGATDIVFLGTGGSSLGAQALAQLKDYGVPGLSKLGTLPRTHFLDNLDPLTFEAFLAAVPLKTTHFVAVSKSGGTGETLMQTIAVLAALEKAGLSDINMRITGLSEPTGAKRNNLRALLEPKGVPFLEHHTDVGGRYSVLTNVGLLPAAVMGLDIAAIREGARQSLEEIRSAKTAEDAPAALGAAINVAAARSGMNITVLMAYADRLERFAKWWVQLWAESLGKDGHGTQPVAALGPVDQHSQVQLYLGGPKDKVYTVLTTNVAGKGSLMDPALARAAGEEDFAGRRIGDLVSVQGRATAETLAKNGRATRRIHIDTLDERSLGALLMHFMLETILTGYALGVDPFDQPAVEEGKVLAKRYLAEMA